MNTPPSKKVSEEPSEPEPEILEEEISLDETEEVTTPSEDMEEEVGGTSTSRPEPGLDMPEDVVFVEERLYVVPFRRLIYIPLTRRAKKAVSILREFAIRHMKSEYVLIHPRVNEQIWARGISKPPRKLRVRLAKDTEGVIHVLPTGN